jgi:phosphatidylethanolamine-binding protein (PEBP) family uncharacterized protein
MKKKESIMKQLCTNSLLIVLTILSFSLFSYSVHGQESNPPLTISEFSFKEGILSLKIINIVLKDEKNKPSGQVLVGIKITDSSNNTSIFDQSKMLSTQKNEISISIPFKKLTDGKFNFLIVAGDVLAQKKTTLSRDLQLKEGTQLPTTDEKFSISYTWQLDNMCENGRSPRIDLKNVPEGTKSFTVEVTDLDLRSFNHGGGDTKYKGKDYIRAGALRKYYGPCPPSGVTHRYSIVVIAKDAKNRILEKAEYIQPCSGN